MKLLHNRQAKGFTLIEILVVIAIMASLGAIAWVAYGAIDKKKQNNLTQQNINALATCLNSYFNNTTNTDKTPILWADGGMESANALYQMLNCDFDGDGKTDKGLTPFCKELVRYEPEDESKPEGIHYRSIGNRKFAIIDAWGNPICYRLGYAKTGAKLKPGKKSRNNEKETVKGKGINSDFDIYSLGEDGLGDGRTNKDENEDNISNIKFLTK